MATPVRTAESTSTGLFDTSDCDSRAALNTGLDNVLEMSRWSINATTIPSQDSDVPMVLVHGGEEVAVTLSCLRRLHDQTCTGDS